MYKYIYLFIFSMSMLSCKEGNKTETTAETDNADTTSIKISLAQWSFHKALMDKKMDNLDFATKAGSLGFDGVEYVNQFFKDKAQDTAYLAQMTQKAKEAGVEQLLIMVDGEGYLGDADEAKRTEAVNNHYKWVDAAAFLGCHSIRVNAHGEGTAEEVAKYAVDGLSKLSDYAATKNINVLVENHGGYSSDGTWLANVMATVNKPNCGTLPDFGNFCVKRQDGKMWDSPCIEEYDKYKGVGELMPFAKAVSAKSYEFGELGFETTIDYLKMIGIVKDAGYKGYIGVEYEGSRMGEEEGVIATKTLVEKCLKEVASSTADTK
ncbi:MAG TPA: sugar phosphate isomerase/epimerase family protein [Saprospiraceae bacterium]|nr:sugar phosphate isomerase/epimerase family protein [Saprospiraceae bacterium]